MPQGTGLPMHALRYEKGTVRTVLRTACLAQLKATSCPLAPEISHRPYAYPIVQTDPAICEL